MYDSKTSSVPMSTWNSTHWWMWLLQHQRTRVQTYKSEWVRFPYIHLQIHVTLCLILFKWGRFCPFYHEQTVLPMRAQVLTVSSDWLWILTVVLTKPVNAFQTQFHCIARLFTLLLLQSSETQTKDTREVLFCHKYTDLHATTLDW